MSIREQKRSLRQRAILLAAANTFRAKGIEASKMEEIAMAANVSPGTVYNYFPTKDELVRSLTDLYRLDVTEQRLCVLENPEFTPLQAFNELYRLWIDGAELYLSREVWRYGQMVGLISSSPESRHAAWLYETDLIHSQEQLLQFQVKIGHLPSSTPCESVAKSLHAIGFYWWMHYLGNDNVSSAYAIAQISQQFEMIFKAINSTRATTP